MAESDNDHHTSPENQFNDSNKKKNKKLRKRKRSRKLEQELEKQQQEEEKNNENTESEAEEEVEEKKVENVLPSGILSTESFSSLGLSQRTSQAIAAMSFTHMTQVTFFFVLF